MRMGLFDLLLQNPQEQAMSQPVFRFAPSANGLLHLGHAYSALLNAKLAEESGGRFLVRIEDTDQTRCTPEFAGRALEDLAWLGLTWEQPVRVQSEHFADYDTMLDRLWAIDAIYPCFCSRKEASAAARPSRDPDGVAHYGGTCRGLPKAEALDRIATGAIHGWRIDMGRVGTPAAAAVWGDVVIAKKKVGSCYHIAAVTDDALQGVTHVVRGLDIEPATPIHLLLQDLLGLPHPDYQHHKLIHDEGGRKLAKSRGSISLADLRATGATPHDIRLRLGF
jgi:glutamyl-Q tRNA(Asp) synthetase